MMRNRVKASSIRGALAPWRYDVTFKRWIGGRADAFREFTAGLVDVAPGESVLDLGCGTGELTTRLARRAGPGGHVAGVDLSSAVIAGARRRARRAGLVIDYRVASVERLPFADGTVDVVASSLVMHHLAPDVLARAVDEIARVLKPGGRVFVIDFASLDQAGHGHQQAQQGGHGHHNHHGHHPGAPSHGAHAHASIHHHHGHGHAQQRQHGQRDNAGHAPLHDHRETLVGLLKKVGFADAASSLVEFGQRLEVVRGRLAER